MSRRTISLLLTGLAAIIFAAPVEFNCVHDVKCPITLDGRVPKTMALATFDTTASPFNPDYSKGQNLSWSQIILFPSVGDSRFDIPNYKPIEVTIDDRSIFIPGGGNQQVGFRRAGLLMGNGSDATNSGVKTFHWSMMQDKSRSFNLTHEYMMVWHEANDYSANQFSINAGTMLSQDNPTGGGDSTKLDKRLWKILDRKNDIIWTTEMKATTWQNFAVTMDMQKNTLRVYYSEGTEPLRPVTNALTNDNSGGGQFQIGVLKKPTETTSVVYDGYQ